MSQYPLPTEDLEGDLTVTVLETVGFERQALKVSASVDFVETLSSAPSHHAGPIIRWNHDFSFNINPGDGYLHISLCEVDGSEGTFCGSAGPARPVAHAHISILSLLCEDKLVKEGTIEVSVPLELVDSIPDFPREDGDKLGKTGKIADASSLAASDSSAEAGEHLVDISDLVLHRAHADADTGAMSATPRRGPFENFKTTLTPYKGVRSVTQPSSRDAHTPLSSPMSAPSLFLVQQQHQQSLGSPTPTADKAAFSRSQSLLARAPTDPAATPTASASAAMAVARYPTRHHPAALFASKAPVDAPTGQTTSAVARPPSVAHTPMKRASALALLSPNAEPFTLPTTSAPAIYLDLPELVRLRVQWSPRWAEAMCRDIIHMVSGGRGWRKADANKWLTVCGLPSPCDYMWPRLSSGHCRYKYADEQDNQGYGTRGADTAAASKSGARRDGPAVGSSRRTRVRAGDGAPDADYVSPLQVLTFLLTFSIREVSRMHKCCVGRLGGNRVDSRTCLTEEQLLSARRLLHSLLNPAPPSAPASTAALQSNAQPRTGLMAPGTPSRSKVAMSSTIKLGSTGLLPPIAEEDQSRSFNGRGTHVFNLHQISQATPSNGTSIGSPPRKGVLGIRR